VRLLVAGRAVATARAGARGRFVLAGRTPLRAGRYAVAVAEGGGAGRRVVLGALHVRAVTLAAVGDVTFGDGVGWRIARTSPRYPWLDVAPVLRAADIATANLEGAVTDRGTPEPDKLFTFRGPPAAARAAVRFAGIDVFTLANNHSKDYGALALLDTAKAVRDAGGKTVGAGADLAAARAAAVVERGGLRVAFLGYNDVPPWEFTARKGVPGTAPAVPTDIARDVRVARTRADVVVVWFHWGYELQPVQNGRQVELARAAFDAGATVVLGAHAHVLLDVEEPSPRRLVAWSLGNFVFVARSPRTADTGILHVALSARGVVGHRLQRARIVAEQPRLVQPASGAPVGR
jgi:poly-gamma-glutamate synthesis protein (capsule biosynthesis protein)